MKQAKKGGAEISALEYEVINMEEVPPAPLSRCGHRYAELYQKIRDLGLGEKNAMKVNCVDQKHFLALRVSLRKTAERDGKMLCSSRTIDYKFGYFWLVKPRT